MVTSAKNKLHDEFALETVWVNRLNLNEADKVLARVEDVCTKRGKHGDPVVETTLRRRTAKEIVINTLINRGAHTSA